MPEHSRRQKHKIPSMKIFFSEHNVDYGTYTFDYAIYCLKQSEEELPQIYEQGFLPYSANLELEQDVFYLARSLRVNLNTFDDTSENRRVSRICEPLKIELSLTKKSDFDLEDPHFIKFCSVYASERFGEENMSLERLKYVLSRTTGNYFFTFKSNEQILGYVYACIQGKVLHYWFSFFDTDYLKSHSLGKFMMWRIIRWAKDNNFEHVYLGTAYKPTALYKIRDHKGLAYFDGSVWNPDMKKLKHLCETDLERKTKDDFKNNENPNNFLHNL
jgi:arginine-tRNA-protein transferase